MKTIDFESNVDFRQEQSGWEEIEKQLVCIPEQADDHGTYFQQ